VIFFPSLGVLLPISLAADTHFVKHLIEEEEVEHGVLLLNRFGLHEEEEEEEGKASGESFQEEEVAATDPIL
jgi:hypothetical protein